MSVTSVCIQSPIIEQSAQAPRQAPPAPAPRQVSNTFSRPKYLIPCILGANISIIVTAIVLANTHILSTAVAVALAVAPSLGAATAIYSLYQSPTDPTIIEMQAV